MLGTPSLRTVVVALVGPLVSGLLVSASACKEDAPAKDQKADAKEQKAEEDPGEPTLQVAVGDEGAEGPVPPETSMVFFTVEGALLPLACFDKDKKKIESGDKCLEYVASGTPVRVSSVDTAVNKNAGDRTEPQCMAGEGVKSAIAVEGITEGANFKFAAWPPSALKIVKPVSEETTKPENTQLSGDEQTKLQAAVQKVGGGKHEELKAHQVAEVNVDGNDKPDKIYALYVPHPTESEQYTWSGILLAPDGTIEDAVLLETSKSKRDVFEVRGVLDMNGDGRSELWMRLKFEDGGGDRIVTIDGNKAKSIGKWSCGAGA